MIGMCKFLGIFVWAFLSAFTQDSVPQGFSYSEYRVDVQHRWIKFKYWDRQRRLTESHLFDFPSMKHIVKAVAQGEATVLDAERFVEQTLRTSGPTHRLFKQLLDVIVAAARRGAIHGADLVNVADQERAMGWMRAEGLAPGAGAHFRLLQATAWLAAPRGAATRMFSCRD